MKFDFCIGNPPYQESDGGGTGDSAKPIYDKFVEEGIKICEGSLVMITPSRWMKGGKGLDSFRKEMMNNTSLKRVVDYEKAEQCFRGVHIDGGVCYFLIDKHHNGPCDFKHVCSDGYIDESERYLNNGIVEKVIRDSRQIGIIKKACVGKRFSSIVSARNPYGFCADFFNHPERYGEIETSDVKTEEFNTKVYGVKGVKGGAKRVECWIRRGDELKPNVGYLDWKLYFSKAYLTTSTVPPAIIEGCPFEICTETFLQIGGFETREEMENAHLYLKTKFARALLFFNRHSLNISRESFNLIPLQDFTDKSDIDWTKSIHEIDLQLYKKYGLSDEEMWFIEEKVKAME